MVESGSEKGRNLRAGPGPVGVQTALEELAKLRDLSGVGLAVDLFDEVPDSTVQAWAARFEITRPSALEEMTAPIRLVLAAAWILRRRQNVIDGLADLLIAVVHKMAAKAQRKVEKEFLADLRRVNGKTNLLFRLAEAALANPDGVVSEVLFPVVDQQTPSSTCRAVTLPSTSLYRDKCVLALKTTAVTPTVDPLVNDVMVDGHRCSYSREMAIYCDKNGSTDIGPELTNQKLSGCHT